ncbi:MAG TPA: cysteine hydrolase [Phenylobacterium sp.]|jgi:nicotinamidase-related amidase|uniref:cysteine hydrolase n=1 Tax=Phenylobacterium sp. TaxID=1871053 RepID=UPI002D4D0869|nr:cysteine hydrolase [Phenylobacterium sp.]HZZ68360.1 cysteine hydrolase [Phenylobacterium sp.]
MIRTRHGLEIPSSLEDWCDPERMALVVYDMQVGICRQVAGSAAIVERVGQALEAARMAGMRVAFTRHLSLPQRWMGRVQLRMAMGWQRQTDPDAVQPWFLPDAEATQIVPDLRPREDEVVFDKITMSAFDSTALSVALRDCDIRAVALCGIAMEIGIEPTARQACDNGFVSVVLADACGCGDPQARERSLATLGYVGDTLVTDTKAFCAAVRRAA